MKGIKKFYNDHRIFTILMALVIVCLILIATVLIQCFYVGKGKDKYGNRLDDIKQHEIAESTLKEVEELGNSESIISNTEAKITGKIIYIKLECNPEATLVEAQGVAQKLFDFFSEDAKAYYDFNFTLSKTATMDSDSFLIEGAHNAHGDGMTWNLNKPVEEPAVGE